MGRSASTWKKGEKPPVQKPKGRKNNRTLLREALGVKNWADLNAYIEGPGLERCIQEMNSLHGKDFADTFQKMTEYVKPKLARAEILAKIETNITFEEQKNYPDKLPGASK